MLLLALLLLIVNSNSSTFSLSQRATDSAINGEIFVADVIISFKFNDRLKRQRLFGTFSASGAIYETAGDIVQAPTLRACDTSKVDHTMSSHIVVMFYDDNHAYLAGCVSLDNQVSFAQSSKALALVVGSEGKAASQFTGFRRGKIPVVMLNDNQTNLLKFCLAEATRQSSVARLEIHYSSVNTTKVFSFLHLQVLRPIVINIGFFVFIILMVFFIGGLIFIKMKWRTKFGNDAHHRSLAKAALDKMEIRKFVRNGGFSKNHRKYKKRQNWLCFIGRRHKFSLFGSLYSVAGNCDGQDRCSICLEEYRDGEGLRVLFCGHEFHSKCVDPWLISNRRCPLCQYDVVFKRYPQPSKRQTLKMNSFVRGLSLTDNALHSQEAMVIPSRDTVINMPSRLRSSFQYVSTSAVSNRLVEKRKATQQCLFPYQALTAKYWRYHIPTTYCSTRRRQNVFPRRFHRRNYLQLPPRPKISQQRRRFCKHKSSSITKELTRNVFSEQMEAISGYSSDVSSYQDPARQFRINNYSLSCLNRDDYLFPLRNSFSNMLQENKVNLSSKSQCVISDCK